MGGSSSQPRTDRVHYPINAFPLEELYTPDFSESLQENTGFWQAPNPYEVSVEQVATSPTKKKKATHNRKKKTIQSDDAPRQTPWTTEEEIALCKGWLAVSENNKHGNSKKQGGFWCEVLSYMESKTQKYGRRTYDMVLGKWKTVRPSVVRFYGIYNNIMHMGPKSGAGDAYYVQRAMIHYEIDTRLPFKLRKCWEILKDHPKWQEIAIPNFNTGSEGDEVREIQRPEGRDKARVDARKNKGSKSSASPSVNEDALSRLMLDQQDMMFYLQSYDHLVGDKRKAMDETRAKIKAKYNLQY
ncbi:hypothetical protein Tco_1451804 [Tanacetum coccineum]